LKATRLYSKEEKLNEGKKKIAVREGLWTAPGTPDEKPRLIGSRCKDCGEIIFPTMDLGLCSNCQSINLEEMRLSSSGKIYSYSVVMQRPPEYYKGEVPYAIGFVELPEGVRVETLFTGGNPEDLQIGMEVEMVIEKLQEDEEGNEILAYKFKPRRR
jgi:uncharacterized OB-fold protein